MQALFADGAGHALTCCRQEDGVTILGRHLIAGHATFLYPLGGAEAEELLKLVSRGQHALTTGTDVGQVVRSLVGVCCSIVSRINAGVDTCHVAEGKQAAKVGCRLGTHVALGPFHREAQVNELVIDVDGVSTGSERLDVTIDNAGAQIQECRIIIGSGRQQTGFRHAEGISERGGIEAQTGTHIFLIAGSGNHNTHLRVRGILAGSTCQGSLGKVNTRGAARCDRSIGRNERLHLTLIGEFALQGDVCLIVDGLVFGQSAQRSGEL